MEDVLLGSLTYWMPRVAFWLERKSKSPGFQEQAETRAIAVAGYAVEVANQYLICVQKNKK